MTRRVVQLAARATFLAATYAWLAVTTFGAMVAESLANRRKATTK